MKKIIDVAYRYGYETPEAFTKAFRKMHGISPATAINMSVGLHNLGYKVAAFDRHPQGQFAEGFRDQ